MLGVDLNADHLAACVLDACGNPVAQPVTIGVEVHGLRASRRDGRVRAAITALLDTAQQHGCSAIVVENLNFADARTTGRETMGRGQRGKTFRRTVAGIPTARFRDRLTAMATRRGIAVIGVIPPTPVGGAISTGESRCSNRLPIRSPPPSRRGGRHR